MFLENVSKVGKLRFKKNFRKVRELGENNMLNNKTLTYYPNLSETKKNRKF
jgi:hypothetical protein